MGKVSKINKRTDYVYSEVKSTYVRQIDIRKKPYGAKKTVVEAMSTTVIPIKEFPEFKN